MSLNYPLCKCFRVNKKYYIYDAVKNIILEIPLETYKAINDYVNNFGFTSEANIYTDNILITDMKKLGFLQPSPIFEIKNQMCTKAKHILDRKLNFLILCVTHNCNLRCRYCNFSSSNNKDRSHENVNMTYEVGKHAIDFFLEHSCDSNNIDIGFYGGEPLLNWDLIESLINYIESLKINKTINYSLTTNLICLTDYIIEYFVKYNIDILISIDGPKDINDLQRFMVNGNGSYDKVIANINKIKEYYSDYFLEHVGINCVLLYPQMEDEVSAFLTENFNEISERVTITPADLSKVEFQNVTYSTLTQKTKSLSSPFSIEKRTVRQTYETLNTGGALREIEYPNGQCIPGYERLFVDCTGELFPCEKVSTYNAEANIGNIYTGFDMKKVYYLMNLCSNEENDCKKCWAFRFCEICCAQYDSGHCFDMKRKKTYCDNRKKQILEIMKDYCIQKGEE